MSEKDSGVPQASKRAGNEVKDVQESEPVVVDPKKRKVSDGSADSNSDDKGIEAEKVESTNGAGKTDTKNGAATATKAEEKASTYSFLNIGGFIDLT